MSDTPQPQQAHKGEYDQQRELSDDASPLETTITVRVRYPECDPMNVAHHSVYAIWMELARTELLRERGSSYRDLENAGVLFVVVSMAVQYKKPACYDDELQIHVADITTRNKKRGIKLEHEYRITRGRVLLATAQTTLACVGRDGRVQPIPDGVLG